MKIDCSKTVNYLKESYRLCQHYGDDNCRECPLHSRNNEKAASCTELVTYFPEETIDIVQKWSDEHPQKTRKDDLLEKYPNADTEVVTRDLCVAGLGYPLRKDCAGNRCEDCWNMPI